MLSSTRSGWVEFDQATMMKLITMVVIVLLGCGSVWVGLWVENRLIWQTMGPSIIVVRMRTEICTWCILWYDNSAIVERCGMTERGGIWKFLMR